MTNSAQTLEPADQTDHTLLVFGLSGEAFALPVTAIHEVIDPLPITRVPNAAAHAPGLINVRGVVTPVVDVRMRLRMPQPRNGAPSGRIIVLELPIAGTQTRIAIGADAVHEVIEMTSAGADPIPELGARWPEQYVKGVIRREGALVVLLNPETLFAPDADRPSASN